MPTRVLYVHHRPELGGAPASLSYLIRNLDRERFEPHVFCPPGPSAELYRKSGATLHLGRVAAFTHIWASTYEGRRWLLLGRELTLLPGHVRDFARVLRANRFDIVHLNDSPLVPAATVARWAGIPVVWHLRSSLPQDRGCARSRMMRWLVCRLAAARIAINGDVARSFGAPTDIVFNAVDLERFRPGDGAGAKVALGLPVDRPVVLFSGFVYPFKGFQDFIEAAGLLRHNQRSATFLIVGGGVRGPEFFASRRGRFLSRLGLIQHHEEHAKALVRRDGLEEVVRFLPFTPDPVSVYVASDIVVAPSRGPELSRPLLEAAACGRAVVASGSRSGAGVLLPGHTGYLVPRRSPDVLAAALGMLIDDPELRARMGAGAREHAERHFSPAATAQEVMDIYDRVGHG